MSSKIGPEKRGRNEDEIRHEMLPFFIFAAIPIVITIFLAWTFGPSH